MNIFNLLKPKKEAKSTASERGAVASSGDGFLAGQAINEQTALTISAVFACTKLISDTVGTLPLHIYKKTPEGRARVDDHHLAYILKKKPNSKSTAPLFWQATVASMLLRGNGIIKKIMLGKELVGLQFMPYGDLLISNKPDGSIEIYELLSGGRRQLIPQDKYIKFANFSSDGNWGLSVITVGASTFSNVINADLTSANALNQGLSQTAAFSIDYVLTAEQRKQMREETMRHYAGAMNAGKPILLEKGMDIKGLSLNPKDAQLLESRSFSIEEVCRWFGVDPSMIAHGKAVSNWGTGLEQKMIGFLTFTLRPILSRIESVINTELIPLEEQDSHYVEFSIEGLLRADSNARATYYREMANAGIMTRNEIRKLENLPAMDGNADVLMINSATQPIDSLGIENDNNTNKQA